MAALSNPSAAAPPAFLSRLCSRPSRAARPHAAPAGDGDVAGAADPARDPAPAGAADPARDGSLAARITAVGVGGNVALAAFKLVAGVVGNSTAMLSDAVHSLSDVFATAIAYVGVRMARRDPDAGHPYGHERFECLASLALALILAATGVGIGYASLKNIVTGAYLDAQAPGAIALVAAAVSIAVKEAMFWYTRHGARVLNSSAFLADAWHHRSDALSSVGALAGVGGAMLGLPICDPLASAAICVVILKVALDVGRRAVNQLVDAPCEASFEDELRTCLQSVEGVVRVDDLRTRQFGSKAYVDAEIAVDGTLPLERAHDIAEAAHRRIEARYPVVKHITIHENPA